MYRVLTLLFFLTLLSCNNSGEATTSETEVAEVEIQPNLHFGIDLNDYELRKNKIKRGDTFGKILE